MDVSKTSKNRNILLTAKRIIFLNYHKFNGVFHIININGTIPTILLLFAFCFFFLFFFF